MLRKAKKDFSYTHRVIDHKEGINELPKQYLNIERNTIGWGQVDGEFIVKLTNLHRSRPIVIQKYHDISPYFLDIHFETLIIDPFMWMSHDHVEFSEAAGTKKTPNRLTLKKPDDKSSWLMTLSPVFATWIASLFNGRFALGISVMARMGVVRPLGNPLPVTLLHLTVQT